MIQNRTLEILFTLFLAMVCIWVTVEGYNLSLGSLSEIGPGFLLFFEGIFLGLLCLISLQRLSRGPRDSPPAFFSNQGFKGVVLTIGVTLIVAIFFETLGFIISAALFLVFVLRFVGEERWGRLLWVAGLTILFSYCIFSLILKMQLPLSPLGF